MVEFLNRYVSIEEESTYGTEPSGTPVYGEVDDESLGTTYDLMTRQDMSRPISSKSVTGLERSEGDINLALQVDDFVGTVLGAFFPKTDYNTITTGVHTFDEPVVAGDAYRSYTLRVGREEKEHTFTGMVANSMSISATVGEYVMLSASFVGKREETPADLATPSFSGDALDALYFANGTVNFDDGTSAAPGASASVKSFSLDVNLNRDTDNAYAIGDSTYSRAPPAQRREISGTIEFNKVIYSSSKDEPLFGDLVSADGLIMSDAAADPTITLDLQNEDNDNTEYVRITLYNVRFEAPEASVSGRDTNTMSVGFVALYDATASGADMAMRIQAKGTALKTAAF
jgi:hypothetical protein